LPGVADEVEGVDVEGTAVVVDGAVVVGIAGDLQCVGESEQAVVDSQR